MTRPVEIIIVNHNTRDELAACLASLHASRPDTVDGIRVVDNASTDGSAALVRARWPDVRVTPLDRNVGFGAANNVALRESQAALVLFLNSDTVVPAGAVDTLVQRLRERGATAAGPKLVDADGFPEISFGPMLTPWNEWQQRRRVRLAASREPAARERVQQMVATEQFVDWVSGACLLVDRPAALAAGGFDERFFLYEEDVDLCATLRARGGRVLFTPLTAITHLRGRSLPRAVDAAALSAYDQSHLAFYAKHAPFWTPWLRLWLRMRKGIRSPRSLSAHRD